MRLQPNDCPQSDHGLYAAGYDVLNEQQRTGAL
jgi:hypothetical protein